VKPAWKFIAAGLLAALLLAASYAAAIVQSREAVPPPHDFLSFMSANALASTVALATAAFGLFILQRSGVPLPGWLGFWTFAYVAFLIHIVAGRSGPDGGLPWLETSLAMWWGIDLVVAWAIGATSGPVRVARGGLHVAVFALLLARSLGSPVWYLHALGVLMTLAALAASALRVVIVPFDRDSLAGRLFIGAFDLIDRFVPWHRLPTPIAVLNLAALREVLRAKNLHDTSTVPVTRPEGLTPVPPFEPRFLYERQEDGYYNDLSKPSMGSASTTEAATHDSMNFDRSHPGARFGRNVSLASAYPVESLLLTPSPREISRTLLARRKFLPAETLNLLAAAWIQFQTHDWFNHGEPPTDGPLEVLLGEGDAWHECPMRVRRTRPDPTRDYAAERERAARERGFRPAPPTYANAESHWWDASQIYGSNPETLQRLRTGQDGRPVPDGKLFLDGENLSLDPSNSDVALSGFTGNWWLGLSLLHTVFTREHNAICDRVRGEYPHWPDEQVFVVARLINSALMAKIHTVEWTPAILGHPALQIAMNANWWGLAGEKVKRIFGRISSSEAFSGIPGSGVDHHGADYCLTEEFVTVYRMHPLVPDELVLRSVTNGRDLKTFTLPDGVIGNQARLAALSSGATMADLFYSFGRANPGAITLHNFPNFLRKLQRPDGEVVDLATIDILRDRERGVPRYNAFLEKLHRQRIRSFDELANPLHPGLPNELRAVYGQTDGRDNVDLLDTMVGMFAETCPEGFGFSDTAFRVFILMASRRLKSDRFIAADFRPEVYSPVGIDWVNDNGMMSVLLRHYPELKPAFRGVANPFAPWNDVTVP
jgi:Animal haem peroxidase